MQTVTPARSRRLLSTLIALVTAVTALVGVVGAASSADARPRGYIVLTPGDHGSRVVSLQRYLHVRPASGYFGSRTRHAVIRWQARHHRHRTGLVGKRLWRAVQHSRSASRRAPAPSRGGDRVSRLNWRALARCESGGNPRAVNPAGYYGLYQFSPSTWRSVGGSGLPSHASSREQTLRAQTLFRRSGSSPWPVCGRHLFD
jgi:peptidoglycan hydrolase-like protein with peptidoglycan-binding domain